MIKSIRTENEFNEYSFVSFDSNGELKQASSSSDNIIGITVSAWSPSADIVDVAMASEKAYVKAGEAFTAGAALTSDSQGRAISAHAGDNIGAIALEGATASGDVVEVIVSIGRALAETEATTTETTSTTEPTPTTSP